MRSKKQKKIIKAIQKTVLSVVTLAIATVAFLVVFGCAVLQESYKLDPPTQSEVVTHE